MSCWQILGIEPTRDRAAVDAAFEQQRKFASQTDMDGLMKAYREALEHCSAEGVGSASIEKSEMPRADRPQPAPTEPSGSEALNAADHQVVREVIIQLRALLNDGYRREDPSAWKAIICEPPADRTGIRREIARQLEQDVRPMASNGQFKPAVAAFLADWFQWSDIQQQQADPREPDLNDPLYSDAKAEADAPQMVNFWPAVVGWIVALAVLTMLFGGMG